MRMKQTFRNHLKALEFNITVFLLVLGFCLYFNYGLETFLWVQLVFGVVVNFWAIAIHIQYSIKNAGEEAEVTTNGITIWKNKSATFYPKEDLVEIMVMKSAAKDKGSFQISSLDSYYYARITTKAGQFIFITCLMSPEVDTEVQKLEGVPLERRRGAGFLSKRRV